MITKRVISPDPLEGSEGKVVEDGGSEGESVLRYLGSLELEP